MGPAPIPVREPKVVTHIVDERTVRRRAVATHASVKQAFKEFTTRLEMLQGVRVKGKGFRM